MVLTQHALFNTVFHAGASLACRDQSPGVATSLAFPPLWFYLTRLARTERRLSRGEIVVASALGARLHAAVVAQQVFHLELPALRGH
jgi:hypothetical protein